MKIFIFGGTTEGRELSAELADAGAEVTVSVVSEYGAAQQGSHRRVSLSVGPKGIDDMADMIRDFDLVIDATHPYATEVTENVCKAAELAGTRRIRLCRDDDSGIETEDGRIITVSDREEAAKTAAEIIRNDGGNIMLTTGVRDLPFYCDILDVRKVYARVLPSEDSISTCRRAGLGPENIIAMQGPFSADLNEALFREHQISVMITKESGKNSGFKEKLKACGNCGTVAVVIARPGEEGMNYESVRDECLRSIKHEADEKGEKVKE